MIEMSGFAWNAVSTTSTALDPVEEALLADDDLEVGALEGLVEASSMRSEKPWPTTPWTTTILPPSGTFSSSQRR